jgi:predicted Rossmann-fold nucleotide-binding protein
MRKLWFLYHAKALIVFPGGFGTLDELFEVLTLKQTRKLEKHTVPVLLYNREYWNDVINFQKLVDMKLILPEDIEMLHFFDTPEEGFEYLKNRLIHLIKITNYRL